MSIKLRKATPKDLPILEYWDTQQHVIDSDPDDDWNWEYELSREPIWRKQLMAELNGKPIGFIQIIDPEKEETHYWGKIGPNKRAIDIWIGEKENLNKGYGTEMMRQALYICFENKDLIEVLIDPLASNKKAIRFYERIGFKFIEYKKFGEQLCSVMKLSREDFVVYQNESCGKYIARITPLPPSRGDRNRSTILKPKK